MSSEAQYSSTSIHLCMPVYSKKPLVQDGNWLHTAYCILHTVESVMEGKRCKGTISASGDETAGASHV